MEAELRAAEEHYTKAITGLEQITKTEQGALDPGTAATLQKNLAVIDQAISESRAALRTQPASEPAQESLVENFKAKIALLQDTVAHQRNAQGQRRGGGADRLRTQTKRRLIMRRIFCFLTIVVVLDACPVAAQGPDDVRIVVRDAVKTVTPRAYQGRTRNNGPEQTETFSRKVKVGRDGRVSISNISGDLKVTGGSGDDVTIEAVKRTRGDRSQLGAVQIIVDDRPGRVEVRTEYENDRSYRNRNIDVSVDYTVLVPATATVDVKSISGNVAVTGVQGAVHAETVSGTVTTSATGKLTAKTVSGDLELVNAPADADLSAATVSGTIRAKGLKIRTLDLGSVSGDLFVTDIACDRLGVKSVSGNVEFAGTLGKGGRYEINSHSGDIRLALAGNTGFELNANSFSGSIRSDFPVTLGGTSDRNDRRRPGPGRATHAVYGDGSATLNIRTFSGDIVITKR